MLTVCLITATKGRHSHLERVCRFFLNQVYQGKMYHLIYNNSCVPQRLNTNMPANVILVNNCVSYETGKKYENLGEIYNDAMTHVPEDVDIISMFDDDDIFLPNHVEEGVKGFLRAKEKDMLAYKPLKSYFKSNRGVQLMNNVLEPSIFVDFAHIKEYGFSGETTAQHHQWLNPLMRDNKILADTEGKPTLIYNWGDDLPAFKTSGNPSNPRNFHNYEAFSQDNGDKIITPWTTQAVKKYYKV